MNYTFQFGVVWDDLGALAEGAIVTFVLGVVSFCGGALIGLVMAALRAFAGRIARALVNAYVVFFTNTPALVQVYFFYWGLGEVGIRWSGETCLILGLVLNSGAYLTIIMGAGFLSVRRTEMEAGEVMGMTRFQQVRYVIAPHIAKTIYPALANFFIVILVMGTSIGGLVGVEELTGVANTLATVNYRWLEYFTVVAAIYVILTFVASIGLAIFGRWAFRVRAKVF
jgi:polar amino acid transport system permease protein